MQRWRWRSTLKPDQIGGRKRAKLADHAARVEVLLAAEPDLTIAELQTRLAAENIAVTRSAVSRFLAAYGLTRKTRPGTPPSRIGPDVLAARRAWRSQQPELKPEQLVFIDETWAVTNMTKRHGRARGGQRVVAAVPHGHWKTTTFRAALHHEGPCARASSW